MQQLIQTNIIIVYGVHRYSMPSLIHHAKLIMIKSNRIDQLNENENKKDFNLSVRMLSVNHHRNNLSRHI